jgi:hypothetical protein
MRINAKYVKKVLGTDPCTYVEIGVHKGDNSSEFLAELAIKQAWLVDPWSEATPAGYNDNTQADWDALHDSVVKRYSTYDNVEILRMTSAEAAPIVPNDLDLVYIDGDHSIEGITTDLNCWFPKVRMGGILSGDDYTNLDVREAVTKLVAAFQLNLRISPETTQWWLVKEKPYAS